MTQVNTTNIVNTTKSAGKSFLAGYLAVQALQYEVIERLSAELGVSKTAIYNRLTGRTRIRKIEFPVIEKVFAELAPGINPWTGREEN